MIRTLQDLLDVGVNAFAIRLLAKDFERMKMDAPLKSPIHVPVRIAGGKVIWVSFSDIPPAEAVSTPAEPPKELGPAQGPGEDEEDAD